MEQNFTYQASVVSTFNAKIGGDHYTVSIMLKYCIFNNITVEFNSLDNYLINFSWMSRRIKLE